MFNFHLEIHPKLYLRVTPEQRQLKPISNNDPKGIYIAYKLFLNTNVSMTLNFPV